MKKKINLEDIKLLIPDFITGSLSEEESKTVKNAINNSDELRELYVNIKNAFAFTDSVKIVEPSPQYWNNLLPKIHQRIEEREQQSLAKNPISYVWKILVPVAAVLLIFIIYKISYSPTPDISQKEEKKFEQENIKAGDTVKKEIEPLQIKESTEPVITKNNNVRRKKLNIKEINVKQFENINNENINNENIAKSNLLVDENEGFASIAVDEITIFGAGAHGIFDEEIENELSKLADSDREAFLEELKNNL